MFKDLKEYEKIVDNLLEADFVLEQIDVPSKLEESVSYLKDKIVKRLESQKGYIISDGTKNILYLLFMKEIVKKAINMNISFEQMANLINDIYNQRLMTKLLNQTVENIPELQKKIIEGFEYPIMQKTD